MSGKIKLAKLALGLFFIVAAIGAYSIVAQKSPAPAVTLTTVSGQKLALEALRGKVVLVNFWATDCSTCMKEMPHLADTWRKYAPQGYETVAVAMAYDNPGFVAAYALKQGLPFPVGHDADGSIERGFGDVRLTPTSFLIDRNGVIVKRYLGEPDYAKLHALIEALLQPPKV